ncbi:MAG: hypothetical protein IKT02_07735 [Bacteroidales bacterium]|nr:hypothetical protein [Bacteroidales bacterium]
MKKNRISKNYFVNLVSKLSIGKGVEGKFYNTGGVVVVTFECQKGKNGQISKTFRVGRKSTVRFSFANPNEAWRTLTEKHGLQPPKTLIQIELPQRNTMRETRITDRKRYLNLIQAVSTGNYGYINDRPVDLGRQIAEHENMQRVQDYAEHKDVFCHGIGLRYVKLFLNRIIKDGDNVAKMYRLALEIEGVNIAAKKALMKYHSDYYNYDKKEEMLRELICLCQGQNVNYGVQHSTVPAATHVIYFDLPECEQISFHTNLEEADSHPVYNGEWDGRKCSTMGKLESAIWARYENQLREKYNVIQ